MAKSSAMRIGGTMAMRFAVALAIFLWSEIAWPQDAAKSDPNTPLSPQAQARKNFVDEISRKYDKKITKTHAGEPASTLSAEGPDATYYVWRTFAGQSADASQCKGHEIVAARLRKLGFTKLVVIDESGGRCELDPVTREVSVTSAPPSVARPSPVVAQAPSAPAAGASPDGNSAAPAAEPAKPNLPPGTTWGEGTVQGNFDPTVEQKVDARPVPAKVTGEGESALTSKSYVQIGRIHAFQPGKKGNAEVVQELEAAILKKAAEAGGDVVRFSSEGAPETLDVPTGKTKTKTPCLETGSQTVAGTPTSSTSCYTDVHGFAHCMTTNTPTTRSITTCAKWGEPEVIPITRKEQNLVSEGTVWRYDPKLAADIARAAGVAREAAQKAAAAQRIKNAREQEMASRPHITLALGDHAWGAAVNPVTNKAYVALGASIAVIDGSNDVVHARIPVDGSPYELAVNPVTNRIYATNPKSNSVAVIDGRTDTVSATVPVGKSPIGIAVNPTTNKIYVANMDSDSVTVIDGRTNRISATQAVDGGPESVAVNPTTNKIYVSHSHDLVVNPTTNRIYATSDGSAVTVIDGATNTISAKVAGGDAPKGNGEVVVINGVSIRNGEVAVIDGTSNSIVTTVPVGADPRGVAVNPALNKIYVTNGYGDVENVIDGATNTTYSTGYIGKYGGSVAVNPATNRVYIVQQDQVDIITDAPIGSAAPEPAISAGTILAKAIKTDDFATVKEVLARQPELATSTNADGRTPLQEAAHEGSTQVMKVLLAKGADINAKVLSQGKTPLQLAAEEGHADTVELLLDHGADVNAHGKNDDTPLSEAASRGNKDVVEVLLAHGADVSNAGKLLPYVVIKGYKEVAELLLAKGADVNAKGVLGDTLLHSAVEFGHRDVVALLLAKGADVNAKASNGDTPLHKAAYNGDHDLVTMLLAKGADANAKDNDGYTPKKIAEAYHREDKALLKLFRQHGGRE
jgi:YVTN family beta-propeller protein